MLRALIILAVASAAAPALAEPDGKILFTVRAVPTCGICHTLADAGTAGEIGPNLDELMPDKARVQTAVAQGVGVMPAFSDTLSPAEIEAIAIYVATKAGQ